MNRMPELHYSFLVRYSALDLMKRGGDVSEVYSTWEKGGGKTM